MYGSAVGFGFALYEDISYGMQFGAETFIAPDPRQLRSRRSPRLRASGSG